MQAKLAFNGLNTDFKLGDCLFGAVKLTNMDIVVIVLDLMNVHNFHCQLMMRLNIILGVDNRSSKHTGNRK